MRAIARRQVVRIGMVAVVLAARCGGSPPGPSPLPVPAVTIACPQAPSLQSMDTNPVTVEYPPPTAAGGVAPLTTTCTPASGTSFNVGTTSVQCSTVDTRGVTAACSFTVTVLPPPRLTATRFLAFGDSITWGVDSPPVPSASPAFAYPEQVQQRLMSRYRSQAPIVVNVGVPGESAQDGGVRRIRDELMRHRPEVLLLMEGTNDLLGPAPQSGNRAVEALQSMIREAKGMNPPVKVLLATITPQRAGGQRNRDRVAALIPEFNDRVRALAASEQIPVADVYAAMKDNLYLIGIDDLHPTVQGFSVIADVFFESIRLAFEEKPPAPGALR